MKKADQSSARFFINAQSVSRNNPPILEFKYLCYIFFSFCSICFCAGSASAQVLDRGRVGSWHLISYSNPNNSSFSHCSASASYTSGVRVFFDATASLQWRMSVFDTRWNLSLGSHYVVSYQVDDFPARTAHGTVIDTTGIMIGLPNDNNMFQQMRSGQRMHLNFNFAHQPARRQHLALTGTSATLEALFNCARANGRIQNANRQTPPLASPPTPPATSPVERHAPAPGAENRLTCTSTADARAVVTIRLNDRQAFGRRLSCINGPFIADMTPCAPAGAFGLSAPTGAANLVQIVDRRQQYINHMGGVAFHSINNEEIYFDGGSCGYGECRVEWSFTVNRLSRRAVLARPRHPNVSFACQSR